MRIAHISDLHVLDLAGVPPWRFLNKRLTGWANLKLKRNHTHRSGYVRTIAQEIRAFGADHVIITGDLTNLALETEFAAVRQILEEDLGFDPRDVSIIPGNHDVYTGGAARDGRIGAYFADYMRSDADLGAELGAELELGFFPFVRVRGPLVLIGLSSAVPRLPFVAAGTIGGAQRAALDRILKLGALRDKKPVFFAHHPLHNPPSRVKTALEGLHDAQELGPLMGAGLFLHGHLHKRMDRSLTTEAGVIRAFGATSASLHHDDPAKMAGFNVYEFDEAGGLARGYARVLGPAGVFTEAAIPEA